MPAAITLAQDRADITRLNAWLADFGQSAGLDASLLADMKLCLNEAVANIIDYGRAENGQLRISVTLGATSDALTATVEDNSFPFDPTLAPEPARITNLSTAQVGGFGISLMRSSSSELRYLRIGLLNRLTIECRRRS